MTTTESVHGFHQCPFDQYLELDGLNQSTLKPIRRSPAHCLQGIVDREKGAGEDPQWGKLGNAIHTAILEPDEFNERYWIEPETVDSRTKKAKALRAEGGEWREEAGERKLLTYGDGLAITGIGESVLAKKSLRALLLDPGGENEIAGVWRDKETTADLKGRVDRVFNGPEGPVLLDLKSAVDASFGAFQKALAKYGYHYQAAWYLDGWEALTGEKHESFLIIPIEKKPPYASALYRVSPEAIEVGRDEYRRDLKLYAKCAESGEWPDYSEHPAWIGLPGWYMKQHQEGGPGW